MLTVEEIQDATLEDKTLQMLIDISETNSWHTLTAISTASNGINTGDLKSFATVCEELTVNERKNVILCGSRLIVPQSL